MTALNHFLLVNDHVVTEVVKAKLVVCAVGNISGICGASFCIVKRVNDKTDAHAEITVNLTHPLTVTLCKVIVYGNDMYALAGERVEVGGKRGNERFTFTCFHFGNTSLMKYNTADNLNIKVLHAEHSPACLAHYRERFGEKVVKTFAVCKTLLELGRFRLQLRVRKSGHFILKSYYLIRDRIDFLKLSVGICAEYFVK